MEVTLAEDGVLIFGELDPLLTEIFRQIPEAANPDGDERALRRILPAPTQLEGEEEFLEDWSEYVQPELKQGFSEAIEVVTTDLATIKHNRKRNTSRLIIAPNHADAWINALNQARIILAERHRFTEAELEADIDLSFETRRDLALLQMNFYAMLQEILLRWLLGELPDECDAV